MIVKIVFDELKPTDYNSPHTEFYDSIKSVSLDYDKKEKHKLINITRQDDSSFYMVIDDKVVYIMNDSGRTIERIVGDRNTK